ncbi:hypothetical protein EDI_060620 [Entamoeba dispar SAW760]|uniref:Intimal thickness related receptor IRP domain-containing protein n=1 Tax=Entamoeba dispar (strain ATCC PRA-260 / SAW760) TaxID=370354 RepID=B0E745_ENTDS|nr:uncharacterized protein EDI_060620 [Entamoeba dispar SAW760]EDR29656.1 hypothetical protein EDI_060620 [Entamoeba dispar SAW760]|eukprot:EDR29656.1 hypothetical protein EDI_060620 [Entamoeba dispar SAW760]
MFVWLLNLFIISSFSLIIQRKQDCPNKINELTRFQFGTNGSLSFNLHKSRRKELIQTTITICQIPNNGEMISCEKMQQQCQSFDLYDLAKGNITLNINITIPDEYGIYILHCGKSRNIELDYTLHLRNGLSELSTNELKNYIASCSIEILWIITIIIVIIIYLVYHNNTSFVHFIIVGIILILCIKEGFHIYYYIYYNITGTPKYQYMTISKLFESFSDILLTLLITFITKGWLIIYKSIPINRCKTLLIGILIFSICLLLHCFISNSFILLALIIAFFFIIPTELSTLSLNIKVIQFHILTNNSNNYSHLKRKILISRLLIGGLITFWILLFLDNIAILYAIHKTLPIFIISQLLLRFFLVLWTLFVIFPSNSFFEPIAESINSVILNQIVTTPLKPRVYEVTENIQSLFDSHNIVLFCYSRTTNLLSINPLLLDGILLTPEVRQNNKLFID